MTRGPGRWHAGPHERDLPRRRPRPRRARAGDQVGGLGGAGAFRTGGPKDGGPDILEHLLGRTVVVVLAVFVTRAGLM
ncbi:SCO1431 family membrane protein [Streptomyces sp. NPDC101115]|uniref:SCO1431 family membrane protein n=1 Tax=Streptomyces sp. NPDC101115 TaxID=3366106 RepID=UPI00380FA7F2